MSNSNNLDLRPQKGFQEDFLKSPAQITIGGSAAGVGKTFALLLDTAYNYKNPRFTEVFFRRTTPQITNAGGLKDASQSVYSHLGGVYKEHRLKWYFPSGANTKFAHLQYEKDIFSWQGSEITSIKFDELTHFTEKMFMYMRSRNRSTCGITPYIKATCNPDPFSFVADLIDWWLDPITKIPDPEKRSKIRYFYYNDGTYFFGDTKRDVYEQVKHLINDIVEKAKETGLEVNPASLISSLTLISGSIYQNKKLLETNIEYLSNLASLCEEDKNALLHGSWIKGKDDREMIGLNHLTDCFTNNFIEEGQPIMTADIAMKGSDNFVVAVWSGWRWIDIYTEDISNGSSIIENMKRLATIYKIPFSNIVYDADGVGAFVDGFIKNSREFHGNSKPFFNENYSNIKSQCLFKLAKHINEGGVYISPKVANHIIKGKKVSDRLTIERKAIKRDRPDHDGKICVIPKEEMKGIIGFSPDLFDVINMRMYFHILPKLIVC